MSFRLALRQSSMTNYSLRKQKKTARKNPSEELIWRRKECSLKAILKIPSISVLQNNLSFTDFNDRALVNRGDKMLIS